jgi:hypothetical protein
VSDDGFLSFLKWIDDKNKKIPAHTDIFQTKREEYLEVELSESTKKASSIENECLFNYSSLNNLSAELTWNQLVEKPRLGDTS